MAVSGLNSLWFCYALHDALVKPMPGNPMAPSLAESWTVSADQHAYEFKLREGLKFHNGDPFTAEDVKFTFQRYKSPILHEKVREMEIVDPYRVRFHLASRGPILWPITAPWPQGQAGSCRKSTWSRWAMTVLRSIHRAGPLQVCEPYARHRAGHGSGGELLAQSARTSSAWSSKVSQSQRRAWHC